MTGPGGRLLNRRWDGASEHHFITVINCYQAMPATTISIATHKGGTGKTVTAMAVAAALARSDRKTLIVDLDAQGIPPWVSASS